MYAPLITAHQLKQRLQDPNDTFLLLDIREPVEWQHEGIIPGARLVPMNSLPFQLDALPDDLDIVVYCHLGQRSAVTCSWLLQNGITRVYDLSGGTEAWLHAGFTLQQLTLEQEPKPMLLSPVEVNEKMQNEDDFVLLDIRDAHEYAIDGYIEGSVRIPMGELTMRVNELDKNQEIVVYCRTGGRSARVATWMRQQGFSNVLDLDGGVHAWEKAKLPTSYE